MASEVYIGEVEKSDKLGTSLHDASKCGHTKRLKKILAKGINVDYPNSSGQSPLFSACYNGQLSAAQILLKHGANPNERSMDGATPVHAACYSCNMKLVSKLLIGGGDLRLHDNLGRTPREWIMLQGDAKKKYKMIDFIEKTRYFAMSGSSKESIKGSNSLIGRPSDHTNSVVRFVRNKIVGDTVSLPVSENGSIQSMGFGKVYLDNESWHGMLSLVPLVGESCLRHDNIGLTFNNGVYMVMESMTWGDTDITVKRLHRRPQDGGHVDLLINESDFMGKLHHPNILLFMGICQTNNLDGLVLLYERIGCGSLFHYLHDRFEEISYRNTITVLLQICNALIFIHQQGLIHCSVSSHAINLITSTQAKLGNFEYMVECSPNSLPKKSLVTTSIAPNAIYNWLAPELMDEKPAVFLSDMYSLCMVIYEIFEDKIPWEDCSATFIKQKLVVDGYSISCKSQSIPKLFQAVLELGLQFEPSERKLSFQQLQHLLLTLARREDDGKSKAQNDSESTQLTAVTPDKEEPGTSHKTDDVCNEKQVAVSVQDEFRTEEHPVPESVKALEGDKTANNSSSEITQCDDPTSQISSSSCGQLDTQTSAAANRRKSTGKEIQRSRKKLRDFRRSSLPSSCCNNGVEMYRDEDNTFHYSVSLSRTTSPARVSSRSVVGSASTLPRTKKPAIFNARKEIILPMSLSRSSSYTEERKDYTVTNDSIQSTPVSAAQNTSLPSVVSFVNEQHPSPNALYKPVVRPNQQTHPVEIVRDIKTELAKRREQKGEKPLPGTLQLPAGDVTTRVSMGSPGKFQRTPTKPICPISERLPEQNSPPCSSTSSSVFLEKSRYGEDTKAERSSTLKGVNIALPAKSKRTPTKPACQVSEPLPKQTFPLNTSTTIFPEKIRCGEDAKIERASTFQGGDNRRKMKSKQGDSRWYGGMGSVKNLVKRFQEQSELHQTKQMILDGRNTVQGGRATPEGKSAVPVCDNERQNAVFRGALLLCHSQPHDIPEEIQSVVIPPCPTQNPDHFDRKSPETDKQSIGSVDSDEILEWVNFHLNRIKTEISSEYQMYQTSSVRSTSVLDDKDSPETSLTSIDQDLKIEILPNTESLSSNKLEIAFTNTTETETASSTAMTTEDSEDTFVNTQSQTIQEETVDKTEPEEFYFDDVIQPNLLQAKHLKLQGTSSLPDYSHDIAPLLERGRTASEDRKGMQNKVKGEQKRLKGYTDLPKKAIMNPYIQEPAGRTTVRTQKLERKPDLEDSFQGSTTVVSVRTSGKLPGKHTITHTETDLKTGITSTVNKGTIHAQKVVSTVYTN